MQPPLAAAPVEFEQRVHKALKFWYDSHPKEGLLDDLLIAQRAEPALALTRRQRTNLLLEQGISYLGHHNPRDAELLKLRFCFRLPVEEARRRLNYAESTIYSKQNQAITRLAAILYRAGNDRMARTSRPAVRPPRIAAGAPGGPRRPDQRTRHIAQGVCGALAAVDRRDRRDRQDDTGGGRHAPAGG